MKKPLQTFPETAAAARQQSQPAASGAVPADGTALPVVSVFPPGRMDRRAGRAVLSCEPSGTATVADLWQYIRGPVARAATAALRAEPDAERQRRLKALTLSYCTPFGTFSYRNTQGLLRPSGMMVADFDHIDDPLRLGQLRQALIDDPYYQTDLLFVSPRGHGLKWFVHVGPGRRAPARLLPPHLAPRAVPVWLHHRRERQGHPPPLLPEPRPRLLPQPPLPPAVITLHYTPHPLRCPPAAAVEPPPSPLPSCAPCAPPRRTSPSRRTPPRSPTSLIHNI